MRSQLVLLCALAVAAAGCGGSAFSSIGADPGDGGLDGDAIVGQGHDGGDSGSAEGSPVGDGAMTGDGALMEGASTEAGVPPGWSVVEVALGSSATAFTCGVDWNSQVGVFGDTPTASAASCGCSCGSPNTQCSVTMTPSSSPGCAADGTPFVVLPEACKPYSSGGNVLNSSPEVAGTGTCAPMPSTQLPQWSWSRVAVVCAPSTAGTTPAADPSFDVCLSHTGTTQCPAATPYQTRVVEYAHVDDSRSCTSCTCSAPTGVACNGDLYFYNDGSCSSPYGTARSADSSQTCLGVPHDASMYYQVAPSGSCAPSSPTATGDVTPDSSTATTFCCK